MRHREPGERQPLRAVLFDAAGTLIRPREAVGRSYARAAARCGLRIEPRRLEVAFRGALRRAPPMVFPGLPPEQIPNAERGWWRDRVGEVLRAGDPSATPAAIDACFAELFEYYAEAVAWRVVAGARGALSGLRDAGLRLAVASNFDHRLRGLLCGLDLAPYFEFTLLPGELGVAKPDPRFLRAALARLRLCPAEVLYVGDDPERDTAPARRLGLRSWQIRADAPLNAAALLKTPAPCSQTHTC